MLTMDWVLLHARVKVSQRHLGSGSADAIGWRPAQGVAGLSRSTPQQLIYARGIDLNLHNVMYHNVNI